MSAVILTIIGSTLVILAALLLHWREIDIRLERIENHADMTEWRVIQLANKLHDMQHKDDGEFLAFLKQIQGECLKDHPEEEK